MTRVLLVIIALIGGAWPASAQLVPAGPLVFADGRGALGTDVSLTVGPDDTGFFNFTDYDRSLLRLAQVDLTGSFRVNDHITLLAAGRLQNTAVSTAALYARIRPWANRRLDIQVGRIPPTFGAYGRRAYGTDNPLIGLPLGYQYLTSIRADALPSKADDLLRMRGRGWLSSFPIGNTVPDHGTPLVAGTRWDTGVQVHAERDTLDFTGSVTTGTLGNPLVRDDNGGRQVAARIVWHPIAALTLGASGSTGAFITDEAARAAGAADAGAFTQRAWGADAEFSRDHLLLRAEAVVSEWTLPFSPTDPVRAISTSVEGRYKILPGLYAAARLEHLGFSEIAGTATRDGWDAPLTRVEVGGGYSLRRNVVVKLAWQYNTRDGGRVPTLGMLAAQLRFWL